MSKRKKKPAAVATRQPTYPKGTYDPRALNLGISDKVLKAGIEKHTPEELRARLDDPESDFNKRMQARARSEMYGAPEMQAAVLQSRFGEFTVPEMDINWLRSDLEASNARIAKGDMTEVEAMLFSQAKALSAMFTTLAQKAQLNMGQHLDAMETYMRLALKAQSQCRTTLESLAEVKNPRAVAFVKQANIAHGPQQVNNGEAAEAVARVEHETAQNKVLEHQHGERLDFGTASATSRAHQELEAVGAIDRAPDKKR